MEDRRKFFRFESPVNLKYTLEKDKSAGRSLTKNISKGGMAFSADRRLPKEETLSMEFEIPGDNMPVFAQGVVVWSKKNEGINKKIFDIGVKLTSITRLDRSRVLEFAYQQWLKIKSTSAYEHWLKIKNKNVKRKG